MLVHPASHCIDPRRTGASAPGTKFSSLPRWSASGTMAHHANAVPSAAPRLALASSAAGNRTNRTGPFTKPQKEVARQQVTQAAVAAAAAAAPIVPAAGALAEAPLRPEGSMIVEPASQIRDPAKVGVGFLGLAAPGGLGYGAAGTKFSHVRRFLDDEPLAGPVARCHGGIIPHEPESESRAVVARSSSPSMEVLECCGEAYEGYCCRRHYPDDAVVCCKRHAPPLAADSTIRGPGTRFATAQRETAIGAVPRGHMVQGKAPTSARFRPPRRITPASRVVDGRGMHVEDDLQIFDEFDGDLGY